MKSYEEVYEIIKKELSEERFKHSEGVMRRCVEFAKIYGIDEEEAKLVVIAHDIAKEIPKEDRIRIATQNGVELDEIECENTTLIHGKLGAKICKERFGFTDEMCEAIAVHTVGKANMSTLDKILYISDCCEPNRQIAEANRVYETTKKNLDEGFLIALVEKIKYTLNQGSKIHKNSIEAYNYLISNKK